MNALSPLTGLNHVFIQDSLRDMMSSLPKRYKTYSERHSSLILPSTPFVGGSYEEASPIATAEKHFDARSVSDVYLFTCHNVVHGSILSSRYAHYAYVLSSSQLFHVWFQIKRSPASSTTLRKLFRKNRSKFTVYDPQQNVYPKSFLKCCPIHSTRFQKLAGL